MKKLTLQKAEALVASREEKLKLKESQPIKSPKTPTEKKPVSATRIKIYEHSGKWVFLFNVLKVTTLRNLVELSKRKHGLAVSTRRKSRKVAPLHTMIL